MAVNDVYRVKVIAEGREGEWTMTFHYKELTEPSVGLACTALSSAASITLSPVLRALLSQQHRVTRWVVDKLSGTKFPQATFSPTSIARIGQIAFDAQPANSAVVIQLHQTLFESKRNGQVWLSGVPTSGTLGSTLTAAYNDGVLKDFLDNLVVPLEEQPSGDGIWQLIVLSRKHLIDNPGDWEGASASVTMATNDVRLGMMRSRGFGGRRRTKKVEEPPEE